MKMPYLDIPVSMQSTWRDILSKNGIDWTPEKPLLERVEEARLNGISVPLPTDAELNSCNAALCHKNHATVRVGGSLRPELNRYLIYFSFRNKIFRSKKQDLDLANEIMHIFLQSGATIYDPSRDA